MAPPRRKPGAKAKGGSCLWLLLLPLVAAVVLLLWPSSSGFVADKGTAELLKQVVRAGGFMASPSLAWLQQAPAF